MFFPAAVVNILVNYLSQAQFDLYHTAEFAPMMVAATAAALAKPSILRLGGRRRRFQACALTALAIAIAGAHFADSQLPGGGRNDKLPPVLKRVRPWSEPIYRELRAVPSDRRVASGYFMCAALSGRQWVFHFGEANIPFFDLADRDGLPVVDTIIAARIGRIHTSPIVGGSADWLRAYVVPKMSDGWWELERPYDPEMGLLFLHRREIRGEPVPNAEGILGDLLSMRE